MIPMEMKNLKNLEDFKNKIRKWEPDGSDSKLCKDFVSNLDTQVWFDCGIFAWL